MLIEFAKTCFCLLDSWCNMTTDDIRQLEEEIKHELDDLLSNKNSEIDAKKSVSKSDLSSLLSITSLQSSSSPSD